MNFACFQFCGQQCEPQEFTTLMRMPRHDYKYQCSFWLHYSKSVGIENNSLKWHLNTCCAPLNSMNLSFLNLFKSHATFPGPNVAMCCLMTNKKPRRQWSLWMTCVDGSPWILSLPFHPNHKERGRGNWEDGLPVEGDCGLDFSWKLAAAKKALTDSKINGWKHGTHQIYGP